MGKIVRITAITPEGRRTIFPDAAFPRGPVEIPSFSVRPAGKGDIRQFFNIIEESWRDMEPTTHKMIKARFRIFPAGMFVAVDDTTQKIIGCLSSLRMNASEMPRTWLGLTAKGTFSNYNPQGDTLFCPQAAVVPEWRERGVLSKLLQAADDLARGLDIPHLVACSRFKNYADYAATRGPIPVSDFIKASVPVDGKKDKEKLENIPREFRHISLMPAGIEAYEEFARLMHDSAPDLAEDINSFFLLTGRRPYDRNIAMHFRRWAIVAEVIPDACPEDMKSGGAMVLMRYR
ncbi:MAG: GNAT family N-acetyltransferase [Candidatus Micrarchaeota archaeon]|nr:GNAT family N-acetyltransferase [Candidatus Micrarchaeota archaeon]